MRFIKLRNTESEMTLYNTLMGNKENDRVRLIFEDEPVFYTVTVNVNDGQSEMGTVTGGGSYKENTTATITAVPNDGYNFIKWNDDNTDTTREVLVDSNKVFTAMFEKEPVFYTVTVNVNDGQSEMGTVTGGGSYKENTTATITAEANNGHEFTKWSDNNTNATRQVLVDSDKTFTAIFEKLPEPLYITATAVRSGINGSYSGRDDNKLDLLGEELYKISNEIYFKGSNGETEFAPIKSLMSTGYNVRVYNYPGSVSADEAPYELKIEINAKTKELPGWSFESATAIRTVVIPEGIEVMGNNFFSGCWSGSYQSYYPYELGLATVTLPSTIKSIGTFGRCPQLKQVIYNGVTYTSKTDLTTALTNDGVTVASNAFSDTGLA